MKRPLKCTKATGRHNTHIYQYYIIYTMAVQLGTNEGPHCTFGTYYMRAAL
jgi:hypothetical protein